MSTNCINCGSGLSDNAESCSTCGVVPAEPPNVRAVDTTAEREALTTRYEQAISDARSRGCEQEVELLQSALRNSCAVIGSDLHVIRQLLSDQKFLYNNYYSLVDAKFRKRAREDDERRRRVTGAIVLDGYGHKIVYAALSLDGVGLRSYGPYSITLREVAVALRATVLEENSFAFVEKRCTLNSPMPRGYRATWSERDKLGVAKLAGRIVAGSNPTQFPGLVMVNGKDRATDEFLEIHIYGVFDGEAIESVRGPSRPTKSDERAVVGVVKGLLLSAGKKWVDA